MSKGILLLSGGAKVALARILNQSARKRGFDLHISDSILDVPTRLIADRFIQLPSFESKAWIQALGDYISENEIKLLIPSRHSELGNLAAHREEIESTGAFLALSSRDAIDTCLDKWKTYQILKKTEIPTPDTLTSKGFSPDPKKSYISKPRFGSASIGVRSVEGTSPPNASETESLTQEIAPGKEFTINAYVDHLGQVISAIPHERLVTESGEVVQAKTKRIPLLIETAEKVVSAIPGFYGPINIQVFYDEANNSCQITDINPRLGGGFPLAHQAKGEFIEWLCQENLDQRELRPFDRWTDNLLMMRYREALFEIQ
ncbi:MAG: ATP-grasp domain-containing protein [Symploca sp. SIO2D2]|nr:ATP-grasp domain-containing protein [Symploca sp. SIO2D2]